MAGERLQHAMDTCFVIHPFHQFSPIYINLENEQNVSLDAFSKQLNQQHFELNDPPTIELVDFESLVQSGINEIEAGHLEKVVLARQKLVDVQSNPLAIFKNLCENYTNCFVHLIYEPNKLCSIGASPELLLQSDAESTKSVSMAGTIFDGADSFTAKENEEQAYVTKYITAQFERLGLNTEISDSSIDNSQVKHLYSTITTKSKVDTEKALALLQLLHPTPAVCGYPLEESRKFILDQEGFNRYWYSGYLGVLDKEEIKTYVNLRCANLYNGKALLYAGAGITKDSNPHAEFLETEAKMEVMNQYL